MDYDEVIDVRGLAYRLCAEALQIRAIPTESFGDFADHRVPFRLPQPVPA